MAAGTAPEVTETARLTADVVVTTEVDGEPYVLLIERGWNPFVGRWAFPGGHVDAGETTVNAAWRELVEETDLTRIELGNTELALIGVYAAPGRDPRGRYVTWVYLVRADHPAEPTAGDDATNAEWWPLDDALDDPSVIAFDHHQILRDVSAYLTEAAG